MTDHCPHCGQEVEGGAEGCRKLFEEIIAREFSRPEIFQVHRLTVDCYALQHPDRYMKSAKSYAAHLIGMCASVEREGGPEIAFAMSAFLNGNPELEKGPVAPPGRRGELTVRHVQQVEESAAHVERVKEWAASIWPAWACGHERARVWLDRALEAARREGRGAR